MPIPLKKPVIIFDFDGTLVDSFHPALDYIFSDIIPEFKITEISRAQLEELRANSLFEIIAKIRFGWFKIPLILWKVSRWAHQHAVEFDVYDHVPELIHTLKQQGYTLHILTSNQASVVKNVLRRHRLLEEFSSINASGGLFNKGYKLARLLHRLKLDPADAVYIGDEIRDIEACHQIPLRIISVSYGFNSAAGLRSRHPDFLVEEPRDILNLIEKLHHESIATPNSLAH